MYNMNNFSPNMLKTFDECQKKFFFKYIQKLSVPQPSEIFEKGKKIHALANYYLSGENIEKLEEVLTPDEKITWDSLKSSKYFQLNVVNTEYNLSCKIGKYWVGGRLDALVAEGTGNREQGTGEEAKRQRGKEATLPSLEIRDFGPSAREGQEVSLDIYASEDISSHLSPLTSHFFILDYKTGNIPQNPEQDFQTIVYLLCADKFLNKKGGYKSLKFVYLGLKNNTEKEILFTDNLKKQYEEKILSTCKKIDFAINSNVFQCNKERCKTCEYIKFCDN
ncbi:MAG: PD-(D/E)XK nuclease family protein [Candidatus Gastranaerophilales bacterium]|nr:PD-(D/E)XK nuclease family protein [Candidatus Gastranaerophilales bacterium]